MKKSKIIEYIFSIVLCAFTFFNLFVPSTNIRVIAITVFLIIYFFISNIYVKIKRVDSVHKSKIITLVVLASVIYIMLLYVIGIFVGFYKNQNGSLSIKNVLTRILPYILIVVFSELIRESYVTRKNKKLTIIITIGLIFADMTMFVGMYNIKNLNGVLALIGFVFLPAISINIFGNYIVNRYGIIPNILYRLMNTIYMYIFPILPDIYMFFQSVFKFVYPYIVYVIIDKLYEKGNFKKTQRDKKISIISLTLCLIIILLMIMLISCKFRYGIIVTGSSSMTGSINKGDAVVFEQYRGQPLEKGQVIIFYKDDVKIIHRIQTVQTKNGQTVCYTKGDSNQQADDGYRMLGDIVGIAKFRIIYIGWPTLWLNDLFNKIER